MVARIGVNIILETVQIQADERRRTILPGQHDPVVVVCNPLPGFFRNPDITEQFHCLIKPVSLFKYCSPSVPTLINVKTEFNRGFFLNLRKLPVIKRLIEVITRHRNMCRGKFRFCLYRRNADCHRRGNGLRSPADVVMGEFNPAVRRNRRDLSVINLPE